MKTILCLSSILLATTTFATTLYPGNTDGPSAGDLRSQPPVYYPPAQPNPLDTSPQQQANPQQPPPPQNKTNPQLPTPQLPPSSTPQ